MFIPKSIGIKGLLHATLSVIMKKKYPIIVSLDGIPEKEALNIAKKLKGLVWGFKINDLLFSNIKIISKLKKFGNVFADAKLYDIPNTVGNSVRRLSNAGADMITVHISGGLEMLKTAKQNSGKSKIIGVTILTSFSKSNSKIVKKYVKNAVEAKLDGIVCGGMDLKNISKYDVSKSLIKVVPGIRPTDYKKKDDQKRTVTPKKAIDLGADYLVIGRPITYSKNPKLALQKILLEIS